MPGKPTTILTAVLTAACCCCPLDTISGYQFGQRWSATATDGGGLIQGDPTTITWSIVPDGTNIPGEGLSDLIVDFDNAFNEANAGNPDLTTRGWWQQIDASFQRWSELSGNTYVYEPNDDGTTHNGPAGILGVRGDVRIAGNFIDGANNTLAYNFFPNDGDMVLDTGDVNFFSNQTQNYRRLRNVVMHEHGHGFGLNHVVSANANFLMEPSINTTFDGPQLDDIRGIHRGYGDKYEKDGGNDSISNATGMGLFGDGDSFVIGIDGRNTFVNAFETDFVSIDDNSDTDYFSFGLTQTSEVTIDLTPVGPTYNQGPQGGNQSPVDASAVSNLTLALFDSQSTQLALSNVGGNGIAEQIADFELDFGEYFIRVTGTSNVVQMYELELNVVAAMTTIDGDFNDDGLWNCADIDMLTAITAAGSNDADFDLDENGVVDAQDIASWLVEGGANNPGATGGNAFLSGDANLDGVVDGQDFIAWNNVKFTDETAWCTGNFNGDPVTDGQDFILWNTNKFMSSDVQVAVPEPSSACLLMIVVGCLGMLRRR